MQQKIIFFSQLPERQKEIFYNVFIRKDYQFTYDDTTGLYYAYITVNDQKNETKDQESANKCSTSKSQQYPNNKSNRSINHSETLTSKQQNRNLYESEILFKRSQIESKIGSANRSASTLIPQNSITFKHQGQASQLNSYSDESERELSQDGILSNKQFQKSSSYIFYNNSEVLKQKSSDNLHGNDKTEHNQENCHSPLGSDYYAANSQCDERQSIDQLPKLISLDNNKILDPSEDIINNYQKSFINDIHESKKYTNRKVPKHQSKSMYVTSESQLIDLVDAPDIITNPYSREKSLLSLTGGSMSEDHNILNSRKSNKTQQQDKNIKVNKITSYTLPTSNQSATLFDLMTQQKDEDINNIQQNISPITQNDIQIFKKSNIKQENDDFFVKYYDILQNQCIQYSKTTKIPDVKLQTVNRIEQSIHCFLNQIYKYRYNAHFQYTKSSQQYPQAKIQQIQKDFQQLINFYFKENKNQLLSIFKQEGISSSQQIYLIILRMIYTGKLKYIQHFYELPGSLAQFSHMYYQILTYGHKLMTYEDVIKVIGGTYIEVKQRRQAITFLLKKIRNLKCSAEVTKISNELCIYISGKSLEKSASEESARSASVKQNNASKQANPMQKQTKTSTANILQDFNQHMMLDKAIECDFIEHFPSILNAVIGSLDKSGQLAVCAQLESDKLNAAAYAKQKLRGVERCTAEVIYTLAIDLVTQSCLKIVK